MDIRQISRMHLAKVILTLMFCAAAHRAASSIPGTDRSPVVRMVGLSFGTLDSAMQTSAGGDFWSPVVLVGSGAHFRLQYQRERPRLLHAFALTLSSIDGFSNSTGVRKYDLPEGNNHRKIGLEYGLTFNLFRNVPCDYLDIGVGPRFRLEYLNTRRIFDPDINIRFHEGYADMAFAISARFRPTRIVMLNAEFGGGIMAGLSRHVHSVSGRLPARFSGGWHVGMKFEVGIGIGRRFWLAPVYEIEAQSMEWTWGMSYRRWTRMASLSLRCVLGARD